MTDYGVSAVGFLRKPLPVILDDLAARQRGDIDPNWNTESDSLAGQYNGIIGDALAQLWEVLEAVYASGDRGQAEDAALDAIGALTGTLRLAATKSTVTLALHFDAPAVTVPKGSVVSVLGNPAARFVTLVDVTGDAGAHYVAAEAETAGPVHANSGTLTVIETPVTGWSGGFVLGGASVINAADAVVGKPAETNAQYRRRQVSELASPGGGTVAGITADLLTVVGVAVVLENVTARTSSDGIPPHAFEAIVYYTGLDDPGLDAAIAASIWKNKPAGIDTHGADGIGVTVVVTDADGDHNVAFTMAAGIRVYTAVRYTPRTTDRDLIVQHVIDDFTKTQLLADGSPNPGFLTIGSSVFASRLLCAVVDVVGVVDADVGVSLSAITNPEDGVPSLVIDIRHIAQLYFGDVALT